MADGGGGGGPPALRLSVTKCSYAAIATPPSTINPCGDSAARFSPRPGRPRNESLNNDPSNRSGSNIVLAPPASDTVPIPAPHPRYSIFSPPLLPAAVARAREPTRSRGDGGLPKHASAQRLRVRPGRAGSVRQRAQGARRPPTPSTAPLPAQCAARRPRKTV